MKRYERRAALLWMILAVAGLGLLIASLCLEQRQMPWVVGLFWQYAWPCRFFSTGPQETA